MIRAVPLGKVARFIRGITFKPDDVCKNFETGSVVCMRTKNVQTTLDVQDLISVPQAFMKREEQRLLTGDLLISSANSWNLVGKASWVPNLAFEATAGGFISILRCNRSAVDPRYFYHWVTSGNTQHHLRHCGRQTTNISNLDFGRAMALEIPLPHKNGRPDLAQQKRIAAILDKADAIRHKRQQALRLTDEFLRSVFLDMFGDPVTNPMGWGVAKLSLLGNVVTGSTPPSKMDGMFGGDIPFVTPGDLKEGLVIHKRIVTEAGARESRIVRKGATFVCCIGATIGKMGKAACRSAFNQQINAVEWGERITDDYGLESLKFFKKQIARRGSSTTLPILNKSSFQEIEIPVPPRKLQDEFTKHISSIETLKRKQNSVLVTKNDIFSSLQQRAFRGEL